MTEDALDVVRPWFADPDTRRFLGGPEWPARMLALAETVIGTTFRGTIQTGSYHWIALDDHHPVGCVDLRHHQPVDGVRRRGSRRPRRPLGRRPPGRVDRPGRRPGQAVERHAR